MTEIKTFISANFSECFYVTMLLVFVLEFLFSAFRGRKLRKTDNLVEKLNGKFLYKYITMVFLICTIIFAIIAGITQFIYRDYYKYFECSLFFITIISFERVYYHDKISLFTYDPSITELNKFFKYFIDNKLSYLKYTEIITGLSQWVHHYFRVSTKDSKQSELINKLELLLRPDGLCLAAYHKSDFLELCKVLYKEDVNEYDEKKSIDNIMETYNKMLSKKQEKYKLLDGILFDTNIMWYCGIIVLHFIGCILISTDKRSICGNLLLYIPGDVLLLLVYKGIVKQQKENNKS